MTDPGAAAQSTTGTHDGHPYWMSVDMAVIESLGINLYSNAAAVLSELVANAYDADATHVTISWKEQGEVIVVTDNGAGMTRDQINERFLKVGYKKREVEGTASPKWNRPYMGRKGIGKLSVFSIATTVCVYSVTGTGEKNGLRIDSKELLKRISAGEVYYPDPIEVPDSNAAQGTTIILSDLKSKRAALTELALRKRLARRFDVIAQAPEAKGGFYIDVNGKRITWDDRQELKKLEFIWEFGEAEIPAEALPKNVTRFIEANNTVDATQGWKIAGWVGTAGKPTDLTSDDEAGSLKNIIVLARKRPIQEGIVEKLDFSRLFGNYVTGQIEADFLDLDGGYDDIATTDRQRLIEDDERVIQLRDFLRTFFIRAADQWSKERPKKQAKDALEKWPKLREWVDGRPAWQRDAAEELIGTIASIELEAGTPEEARVDLFRAGILAFERLGLRHTVDELRKLNKVAASDLLPLLGEQAAYEEGLWVDILRSRVESIAQFENLTQTDEKEKVLQQHLFKHLWLLDPSWERAAVGGHIEQNLRKIYPGLFAQDATGTEIKGRLDIHYATAAGKHIIVELKRYSINEQVETYREQGLKYYNALKDLLDKQSKSHEGIEIVFVLGSEPKTANAGSLSPEDYIRDTFRGINGRYVLYDELIENARRQYAEYLEASAKARDLDELLGGLDPMS